MISSTIRNFIAYNALVLYEISYLPRIFAAQTQNLDAASIDLYEDKFESSTFEHSRIFISSGLPLASSELAFSARSAAIQFSVLSQ